MPDTPFIFLSFANDLANPSQFLTHLEPEKEALEQVLFKYKKKKWGDYRMAVTSEPRKLIRDLNQLKDQVIIFHFSGHNGGTNLQFKGEDGKPIAFSGKSLFDILAEEDRLKLVFLNACATKHHIEILQEAGISAIIATERAIPDSMAKDFSDVFYDSLVAGNTLKGAFNKAQTIVDSVGTEERIFRGFVKKNKDSDHFPWGLHILNEEILAWKLRDEVPDEFTGYPKRLNQLPGLPAKFVGREEELKEVTGLLQGKKPVLLLNGIGGIGKTTLAQKYLHEAYELYDHIAWISVLSENEAKETGFRTTAEALGGDQVLFKRLNLVFDPEQAVSIRAKSVLEKLEQVPGNNLLVIDNAGLFFKEIQKSLPRPPEWQVLVTSRKELPGLEPKRIDELPPDKALELFYLHYPAGKKEEQTVKKLLAHIGYHTLSVDLFAKTCKISPSTTPNKIYELLQEKRLSALSRKVWAERSKREVEVYSYLLSAFELAGHELSEGELSLLTQLAVLPSEELSWELLLNLFQVDKDAQEDFETSLMGLVEKGWITHDVDFKVHQLIQEVIRYQFPPTGENCSSVIEGVADLLAIDQSKDNPVDKFPYVVYGESIISHLDSKEYGKSLSSLWKKLAEVYRHLGRYHEAVELHKLALDSDLKNFGEDSSEVAVARNELALAYQYLGRYEEAIELYQLALESDQKNFGPEHPNVATTSSNLALVYQDLGRYEEASKLLEAALKSYQTNFGDEHPYVAISRSNLATVYQALGRYEDAAKLLEAALKSDQTNFGEQHPTVARSSSNLATVYQALGRYEDAAKLLEATLKSYQINFGEQHPYVAKSSSNLAMVYKDLGRYEEAAKLLEAALQSDQTNFGDQHPSVAISRSNLALVYQALGRFEDAAKLLEAALKSAQTNFGEQHPSVARRSSNLAMVYRDLGRYEDAAKLLEAALKSDQTNFGEQHPTVARTRSNLALVYKDLGRYEEAAKLLEAALKSDQTNFGEQHPSVARSSSNLATVYLNLGRKEEAKELFQSAYKIFFNGLGKDHPYTLAVKEWIDSLK